MFKKLINKFIVLNMTIISIILLISFCLVYFTNLVINDNDNQDKLMRVSQLSFINRLPSHEINGDIIDDDALKDIKNDFIDGFLIQVNSDYELIDTTLLPEYTESELSELVKLTEGNTNEIKYKDEYYLLDTRVNIRNNEEINIAFLNVTETKSSEFNLLMLLIITWLLMLIIIYFVSKFFATKNIEPIKVNYEKQKRFISDTSHELKTPLAIINSNADAALINKRNNEKWIGYIKKEVSSMNKLVNDLLTLTRSEYISINKKNINLSNLTEELITSLESVIYEKNINLNIEVDKNIKCKIDIDKYRQVFLILLDNAIKYVNDESQISVKLYQKRDIILEVSNSGYISEKDINNLFDRFYRCDESRVNNDESYGLGLSILKEVINNLGWEVLVTSKKLVTFKIIIKN